MIKYPKDCYPTDIGIEIDFYLKRIGYYRNMKARFELSNEFDDYPPEKPKVLKGYGDIEFWLDKEGHERKLCFWINAMIWFIDLRKKQADHSKKDIDKPKDS